MDATRRRVPVIGLDGGTWTVLDRMVEAGVMPHLAAWRARGAAAVLRSTTPALTPTAWSTFMTGMNPGRHEVFSFAARQMAPDAYFPPLPNRTTLAAPTLWRRLSDAGRRCIVLGTPLTYPPEPINGALVTGMFTPGLQSRCTWPEPLKDELLAAGCMPEIDILPPPPGPLTRELVQPFVDATDKLRRAALHLMRRPWDFAMVMFLSTDRFQHRFWNDIVAGDEVAEPVRRFYGAVDAALGDLLAAAGPEATCLLMSDHGFGRCDGRLHLGNWFAEHGHTRFARRNLYDRAKRLAAALGVKNLLRRRLPTRTLARIISHKLPIDWSRTQAYVQLGGVQINLAGREPQGVVPAGQYHALRTRLRDELKAYRCPRTQRPVFRDVYYPEQLYEGPQLSWAADLVLEPATDPSYECYFGPPQPSAVEPCATFQGHHRPEGVFVAAGPDVAAGQAGPFELADLAPTVLRLQGLAATDDFDGRVLDEVWNALPTAERAVTVEPAGEAKDADSDDQALVAQRLRAIGYLD